MSEVLDEGGVVEQPEAEAPENVAEETAAETAAPAEPALDPLELQAELEYMRSQNAEMRSYLESLSQMQGQRGTDQPSGNIYEGLVDEFGQLNVERFAQLQTARDQALLQQIGQMFNPIQESFQSQQEATILSEGEQRLADILADDVARNGEFASDPEADARAREFVAERASQLFPEIAERYGANPRSAEIAMTRAASEVRGLIQTVGGAAVQQNQNQLATLANANSEVGGTTAGVEAPVIRLGETSASRFAASN